MMKRFISIVLLLAFARICPAPSVQYDGTNTVTQPAILQAATIPLDIRAYGASLTSSDNSSAIQSAINASEISGMPVFIPPGRWTNTSKITLRQATMYGVHSDYFRSQGGTNQQSVLYFNIPGTNTEAVLLQAGGSAWGQIAVKDLWIELPRNNVGTMYPITGVSSRYVFTVGTNAIPATPTYATSRFPYYGHCFFFTPGGNYLGGGVVTNISKAGATATVTIDRDHDWFATPTSASGKLDTTCQVIFSPSSTALDGTTLYPDATRVGTAGIRLYGGYPLGYILDDIGVMGGWTSITFDRTVNGNTYCATMGNFFANSPEWAGFATALADGSGAYDTVATGRLDVAGYNSKSVDIAIDNSTYRCTMYGLYNVPAYGGYNMVLTDYCLVGLTTINFNQINVQYLLVDDAAIHGVVIEDSYYAPSYRGTHFNTLWVYGTTIASTNTIARPDSYAVWVRSTNSATTMVAIDEFDNSVRFNTQKLGAVFNLNSAANNHVSIASLANVSGATNVLASGSGTPYTSSMVTSQAGVQGFYSSSTPSATIYQTGASDTTARYMTLQNGGFIIGNKTTETTPLTTWDLTLASDQQNESLGLLSIGSTYHASYDVATVRGSIGSYTATGSGDYAYGSRFIAYDGAAFQDVGHIKWLTSGAISAGTYYGEFKVEVPYGDTNFRTTIDSQAYKTVIYSYDATKPSYLNVISGNVSVGNVASDPNVSADFEVYRDGNNSSLTSYSAGGGATFQARAAKGTVASPTVLNSSGVVYGAYDFVGYDGSSWKTTGRLGYKTAEAWSVGNNGTSIEFYTTPTTTASFVNSVEINANGDLNALTGNVNIGTIGKTLTIKGGANAKSGTFTANGVTAVTVSSTAITANSLIIFTLKTVGGTVGAYPTVKTITPSTGFTVACTALDTSVYNWGVIEGNQ